MRNNNLFVISIFLILLISQVSATSLNFQNPHDYSDTTYIGFGTNGLDPSQNTTWWSATTNGGNNVVGTGIYCDWDGGYKFAGRILTSPYATTYSASTLTSQTLVSSGSPMIIALDVSKNPLYTYNPSSVGRFEVKVLGGVASIYQNGVKLASSGSLSANPSYIAYGVGGQTGYNPSGQWAYAYWDDQVYSDAEEKLILGLPESDGDKFIILDDFINNAADGLYNTTSGTQADANYMVGTWSRGNSSGGAPLENQSITLINYDTKTVYWTGYTGLGFTGTFNIPIKTNLIDVAAPDGYYALTSPGTLAYSNLILKKSLGASVSFDRDEYSINDPAHVTWDVQTGSYWDTSKYSYRASINDAYGVEKYGVTLTERTGSFDYTFASTDNPGVYHAQVTATPVGGGNKYWLAVAYAELTEYGVIYGHIVDKDGVGISGANITFDQGIYKSILSSGYDGNYTTPPFFITGTEMICNVTKAGYRQHNYTILPKSTKTKHINFTLPLEPESVTDLGIDGVAMEGYLTPGTNNIVNGYGNTIPFAIINVTNSTTGEFYQQITTVAGYYKCHFGTSCTLVLNRTYAVEGSKTGFQNSSIYLVKAEGS